MSNVTMKLYPSCQAAAEEWDAQEIVVPEPPHHDIVIEDRRRHVRERYSLRDFVGPQGERRETYVLSCSEALPEPVGLWDFCVELKAELRGDHRRLREIHLTERALTTLRTRPDPDSRANWFLGPLLGPYSSCPVMPCLTGTDERIELVDKDGETFRVFTFDDINRPGSAVWPPPR